MLNKKIEKIFEYDSASPLFAKIAANELDKKNIEKAVKILEEGIKNYPVYPVPYLLLGKAYALSGNYSLAVKNLKHGADLIPSKKTYEFYLRELENLRREKSILEPVKPELSAASGIISSEDKKEKTPEAEKPEEENKGSFDEDLESLAKKISSARINPETKYTAVPEKEEEQIKKTGDENIIASDTLAKIYAAQGEINEAINVYKKLKVKHPDKEKYYSEKIEELKSKLGE